RAAAVAIGTSNGDRNSRAERSAIGERRLNARGRQRSERTGYGLFPECGYPFKDIRPDPPLSMIVYRPCNSREVSMTSHCFRLAASFAVLLISAAFADAATTGECSPTKNKYLASEVSTATNSTVPIAINDGSVTFMQGGTSSSCVIVQFFAETT